MNDIFHEIEVITDEYHIWHGAIPIFNTMAIIRIDGMRFIGRDEVNHEDIDDININLEPNA
jgi:hypothetical protein